jgi:hypothetical protein
MEAQPEAVTTTVNPAIIVCRNDRSMAAPYTKIGLFVIQQHTFQGLPGGEPIITK